MNMRVLRYFLVVADTSNITKAANQLHITQPTLSRQIMELENELGAQLFNRHNHHLKLNHAGMLFQQQARTMLELYSHAKNELHQTSNKLTGTINLGCVVTSASAFMMRKVDAFLTAHPAVRINFFEGDSDTLKSRMDSRLEDIICLIDPVEVAKYNFMVLPIKDTWGVLMRSDDPLARRDGITKNELYKMPLILGRRNIVRDDLTDVLKLDANKLNIRMRENLPSCSTQLIKTGRYYDLTVSGVAEIYHDPDLTFVPFYPTKRNGHVLAWRKNTILSPVAQEFLQSVTA